MKFTRALLIFGCVAIGATVYFLPRRPSAQAGNEANAIQQQVGNSDIDRAVHLIENGENPMEGIGILKQLELEDENNFEVVWLLAKFSLMSGQIEKAQPRLQKLAEKASTQYPEAVLLYARTLIGNEEKTQLADSLLQTLVTTATDTSIVVNAKELLMNLRSNN